jgi:hypothetical protein
VKGRKRQILATSGFRGKAIVRSPAVDTNSVQSIAKRNAISVASKLSSSVLTLRVSSVVIQCARIISANTQDHIEVNDYDKQHQTR